MVKFLIRSKTHGSHWLVVDDKDAIWANQWKWYIKKNKNNFYAIRSEKNNGDKKRFFHRDLINIENSRILVDHKNGNGLDNRRENLRVATFLQNSLNRGKTKINKSGYKGVSLDRRRNKWVAEITINGAHKFIGYYDTPEQASNAYETRAKEVFGEFYRWPDVK